MFVTLYIVYVIYDRERLRLPTELLFSLVDSLRIVPLRGALTLLTLKDHPSKPGNQMAFIQYVERDVDAQKLVYLGVSASI